MREIKLENEVFCRLCSRPVFLYANLNYAIIKNNSDLLDDFMRYLNRYKEK